MTKKKIKDQPYLNLLIPKGSTAGREDLAVQRARINKIDFVAAQKIFVPFSTNMEQRKVALELRVTGKHIVCGYPGQVPDFKKLQCSLHLTEVQGKFLVMSISDQGS
ncbi:MAG: hypothetical protein COA46_03620 [Porticoccaceae bacterium]|nr:MAG: hypothetical protein COA46_03620 [Porticoccaceae bacterium]